MATDSDPADAEPVTDSGDTGADDESTEPSDSGAELKTPDGKHPRTVLAGPYGHPFHPILVTIPIGAWICSLVFDIGSRSADFPSVFAHAAYWLIAIGLAGAALAALFGLLDLLAIPRGTPAFTTGLLHLLLNSVVVVLFAIAFVWRYSDRPHVEEVSLGKIALSVGALAILGVSGYLGGKLAYTFGVRVVDEETQAAGLVPASSSSGDE